MLQRLYQLSQPTNATKRLKLTFPTTGTYFPTGNVFPAIGKKSDTVAVFAVLPRYPRYYRGNGVEIHCSTAVMGLELTVFPW